MLCSHRSMGCCIWFLLSAQLSCLPSGPSLNWSQRGSGLDFGRHSNLLVTYLTHKQTLALGMSVLGSTKTMALWQYMKIKAVAFDVSCEALELAWFIVIM